MDREGTAPPPLGGPARSPPASPRPLPRRPRHDAARPGVADEKPLPSSHPPLGGGWKEEAVSAERLKAHHQFQYAVNASRQSARRRYGDDPGGRDAEHMA